MSIRCSGTLLTPLLWSRTHNAPLCSSHVMFANNSRAAVSLQRPLIKLQPGLQWEAVCLCLHEFSVFVCLCVCVCCTGLQTLWLGGETQGKDVTLPLALANWTSVTQATSTWRHLPPLLFLPVGVNTDALQQSGMLANATSACTSASV